MIIIPEIETVVILVPRTGTGSLRRAVKAKYSQSFMPYRHMEADGVPAGYDRWERVGCVRDPIYRLWSLYKFLQNFSGDHDAAYIEAQRESVRGRSFNTWLLKNETVFTCPYDAGGRGPRFFPQYTVRHPLPENRKSQFVYLRPDLGTKVYRYCEGSFNKRLGVAPDYDIHKTEGTIPPKLSRAAMQHIQRVFRWDLEMT